MTTTDIQAQPIDDVRFCLVERQEHLTIITINRPEVMNALHYPAHRELEGIWDEFAADPDQWVAIITGAGGRAFCAGNDLKYKAAGGVSGYLPSGFGGLTGRFGIDKPIIAAVDGVAMGGGFEIALAADLVIASETSFFALPEPRVGTAATAGGYHRLPRAIGLKRAMGMLLTGRHVGAQEGYEMGFVTAVVPQGEALHEARKWAEQIMECAPLAVRATKAAALRGLEIADVSLAYKLEHEEINRMRLSADYVEGPKAFSEKRRPQWEGR
jgi:crotonobetainyl-CoA hydratase